MRTFDAFTCELGFVYPIRDHKRHPLPTVWSDGCRKTKGAMMTPAELLEKLRLEWCKDQVTIATSREGASASISDLEPATIGGLSIAACVNHLQPFDAIEREEPTRPGFIRSDCRRCGRFLGYRPKRNVVHFDACG